MEDAFLKRALELAENGRGTTHPNPIVGAVVVSGDEIVGEGWHERKGGRTPRSSRSRPPASVLAARRST